MVAERQARRKTTPCSLPTQSEELPGTQSTEPQTGSKSQEKGSPVLDSICISEADKGAVLALIREEVREKRLVVGLNYGEAIGRLIELIICRREHSLNHSSIWAKPLCVTVILCELFQDDF